MQGNHGPLELAETFGGLWNGGTTLGIPLDFPVESASSWDMTGMPGILSRLRRERIPHLELGDGNEASCTKGMKDPFEVQE